MSVIADPKPCTGKVAYDSPGKAHEELRLRRRFGHSKSVSCEVFRCGACGKWHLGRPAWKSQERRRR